MANRFTEQLDSIIPTYTNGMYERIDWVDIPSELYPTVNAGFWGYNSVLQTEFDERTLFLCFLAEMNDQDLMECFGI